ncbi:MAG: exported protein of unknown function [Patescibacteria group bacterium]|nr:exported protein of unknown function [Patescibacteria group bacterium]
MKRLFLGLMVLAVVFGNVIVAPGAFAADAKPLTLQTSPLPISLSADPGKSVTTDLRIKQNGGDTEKLKVSLMKFGAYGEEGKPVLTDRGPADTYFDWVKFDKTVFDAPANVWQTVHMTINLPKSAAFGYYYAVVFSRVGDDVRQGGRTNSLSGATAVLVLLEAHNPNAKRSLQLSSFATEHRIYEFLPAKFRVKLANTGNVHGAPQGDIFIMKGKKQIATLSLNSGGGNILPQSKRSFPAAWSDGFPVYDTVQEDGKTKLDKNGKPVQKLKWDWTQANKFRFGKYTAQLFAVYDDGKHDVPIEAQVSFWVIPWRFLLVLLLVLTLVGFGVYSTVRGTVRGVSRGTRRLKGRR